MKKSIEESTVSALWHQLVKWKIAVVVAVTLLLATNVGWGVLWFVGSEVTETTVTETIEYPEQTIDGSDSSYIDASIGGNNGKSEAEGKKGNAQDNNKDNQAR